MEDHAKNANPPMHRELPRMDWTRRGNTYLNLGQPLPTGLEDLEVISSMQKVLQWLEVHVPSDPGTWAEEDEDWENKIDEEQTDDISEEDITCPVPSEKWEDSSQSQEFRDVSKEHSDQELLQWEEHKGTAAKGEASSKLQSTSPAPAASMGTKEEPTTSPSQASHQQGKASSTIPTSTDWAPSTPSWEEPPVTGVQAGASLLPPRPPGDSCPSLTAIHGPEQPQRQSLLRRALRAVCGAFLGTHRPRRQQQQQRPAPSARQAPGDGCSEPQQRPRRE